jgi:hypothetical protein
MGHGTNKWQPECSSEMSGMSTDFDADAAAPLARRLIRTARDAALGSLDPGGGPHVSHVAAATLADGSPVLLVSDLAIHTQNLKRDRRASLLFVGEGSEGADTNTRPRISLLGHVEPAADRAVARDRFLRRHPDAALYVDFADFHLMRFAVETAHLVAGFGRIIDLLPESLLAPADMVPGIAELDAGACEHMNEDHPDALALMAKHAGGEGEAWRAIGVDPQGVDLSDGARVVRAEFEAPAGDGGALRVALKKATDRARAALS